MNLTTKDIEVYCNNLLRVNYFDDYGPNGIQVENSQSIKKVALAVSVSLDTLEQAQKHGCQTLIVHHGLFWKGQGAKVLTGNFYKKIAALVKNDISLMAYHLPLDSHPEVGNAVGLFKFLFPQKIHSFIPFGERKKEFLGCQIRLIDPISKINFLSLLKSKFQNIQGTFGHLPEKIQTLATITGSGSYGFQEALNIGVDVYLTGEFDYTHFHEVDEEKLAIISLGHEKSEEFGIQLLGERLTQTFGIECVFISSKNPF